MRSSQFVPALIVFSLACGGSDAGALFAPSGSAGGGSAVGSGGTSGAGGPAGTDGATSGSGGAAGSYSGAGGSGPTASGAGGAVDGGGTDAAGGNERFDGGKGGSIGKDGGTAGAGGGSGLSIRCGNTTCDPEFQVCCLHGDAGQCVEPGSKCPDKGILLRCDDPSDCNLGEQCCARQNGGDPPQATCANNCSSGPGEAQVLCDPGAPTPCSEGLVCDADNRSVIPSYAYCAP